MIGTVPLAFIGTHVQPTLVTHTHTHRRAPAEWGGWTVAGFVTKIARVSRSWVCNAELTLLLLVRLRVGGGGGEGESDQEKEHVVCLFDWFAVVYFDFRFKYSNVEGARPLCLGSRCFRFQHWLCCRSHCRRSLGLPTATYPRTPRHFLFLFVDSARVCASVCVCVAD